MCRSLFPYLQNLVIPSVAEGSTPLKGERILRLPFDSAVLRSGSLRMTELVVYKPILRHRLYH